MAIDHCPNVTSHMRTYIIIISTLAFTLNNLYGQNSLNESVIKFKADCSEAISIENYTNKFNLLKFSTTPEATTLNFEIVANCAQKNVGFLSVSGDTLTIDNTDVKITSSTRYEKFDSTGHSLEISEEIQVSDIAFCDCLVTFYYELSTSLDSIKFLSFHERTFELIRTGINAK